ncbi:hypothetical protein TMatcc_006889 [Talaromyces marneffei ATCC 18224]
MVRWSLSNSLFAYCNLSTSIQLFKAALRNERRIHLVEAAEYRERLALLSLAELLSRSCKGHCTIKSSTSPGTQPKSSSSEASLRPRRFLLPSPSTQIRRLFEFRRRFSLTANYSVEGDRYVIFESTSLSIV